MIPFAKAILEARTLEIINHFAGRYPALDTSMKWLTVFGVLPLIVAAVFTACCASHPRRRLGGWVTLLAAVVSFLAAWQLQGFLYRPRPFVYHSIHLLVCYPTDDSFPSIQMAVGAALAAGLLACGGRMRWIWIPYLMITGFARLFCGVENPFDVLGAWIIGWTIGLALMVALNYRGFMKHQSRRQLTVRAAALCVVVGIAVSLFNAGNHEVRMHAPGKPPVLPPAKVSKDSIIRGYQPASEKKLAASLVKLHLPGRIEKVGVAADDAIQVAEVRFLGMANHKKMPHNLIEKESLKIVITSFQANPKLAEVDVWASVPHDNGPGKPPVRAVYSVAARHSAVAALLKGNPAKINPHQVLARLGASDSTPKVEVL